MRKMYRVKSPFYLKRNWKQWGIEWRDKIKGLKRLPNFDWKIDRADLIDKYLAKSTSDHCAFCDKDEIIADSGATVEHFKPKSIYPTLAYNYNNLYNCCNQCQKKKDKFSNDLLRPDDVTYKFNRYFEVNAFTGEIVVKRTANAADKFKAKETIKLYKLNNKGRKRLRKQRLEFYLQNEGRIYNAAVINNYSYRFFIEEVLNISY